MSPPSRADVRAGRRDGVSGVAGGARCGLGWAMLWCPQGQGLHLLTVLNCLSPTPCAVQPPQSALDSGTVGPDTPFRAVGGPFHILCVRGGIWPHPLHICRVMLSRSSRVRALPPWTRRPASSSRCASWPSAPARSVGPHTSHLGGRPSAPAPSPLLRRPLPPAPLTPGPRHRPTSCRPEAVVGLQEHQPHSEGPGHGRGACRGPAAGAATAPRVG
jgi:hypothetical protein